MKACCTAPLQASLGPARTFSCCAASRASVSSARDFQCPSWLCTELCGRGQKRSGSRRGMSLSPA